MKNPPLQKPIQTEYVKSAVRLPPDLHATIQDAAERNGHSMNAEIIARLKMSSIDARLAAIDKRGLKIEALLRDLIEKT